MPIPAISYLLTLEHSLQNLEKLSMTLKKIFTELIYIFFKKLCHQHMLYRDIHGIVPTPLIGFGKYKQNF